MKSLSVLALAALLACAACAPRQQAAPVNAVEPVPASPDAQLARFIGESPEGGAASFNSSLFGSTAGVTVGRAYTSALGLSCREAYVIGRTRQRIAACRQADGAWVLAPLIFADGAL